MMASPPQRAFPFHPLENQHSHTTGATVLSPSKGSSSSSILNSPSSFTTFPGSPPPTATAGTLATPPLRSTCSFAPTVSAAATDSARPAASFKAGVARTNSGSAPGATLLQRRRSSGGAVARGNRPTMNLELDSLTPPLLPTDEIREHIIGLSSAAYHVSSPTGDPGTPNGRVKGVIERAFQQVKSRHPTPYPEKASFLDSDEPEDASEDEEEEAGDDSVQMGDDEEL